MTESGAQTDRLRHKTPAGNSQQGYLLECLKDEEIMAQLLACMTQMLEDVCTCGHPPQTGTKQPSLETEPTAGTDNSTCPVQQFDKIMWFYNESKES